MRDSKLLPYILPVGIALIVPGVLVLQFGARFPYTPVQAPIGALLMGFGMFMQVWTVSLFSRIGRGTPAPWNPPRRLVIAGPYAHVRNPMISGVLIILLGESVLLGSLAILAWALLFFLVNIVYFKLSEEPGLLERFGEEYKNYRSNVPMWLPRTKPWKG